MKKIEKELFRTLETAGKNDKKIMADDGLFLQQLSEWVTKYFGNVKMGQRLNIMAINRGKKK